MVSLQGIIYTALEQSWLVIVRTELYSNEGGSFVIQSIAIVSKGCASLIGVIGWSGGFCLFVPALFCWQVPHPFMYRWMYSLSLGHQNFGKQRSIWLLSPNVLQLNGCNVLWVFRVLQGPQGLPPFHPFATHFLSSPNHGSLGVGQTPGRPLFVNLSPGCPVM